MQTKRLRGKNVRLIEILLWHYWSYYFLTVRRRSVSRMLSGSPNEFTANRLRSGLQHLVYSFLNFFTFILQSYRKTRLILSTNIYYTFQLYESSVVLTSSHINIFMLQCFIHIYTLCFTCQQCFQVSLKSAQTNSLSFPTRITMFSTLKFSIMLSKKVSKLYCVECSLWNRDTDLQNKDKPEN